MRAISAGLIVTGATLAACTVGQGVGSVTGDLSVPACNKDLSNYDMHANFFAADAAGSGVTIRIQNGGGTQEYADVLTIVVQDTSVVESAIEAAVAATTAPSAVVYPTFPIELERPPGSAVDVPAPLVRMTLSLRATCGVQYFTPGDPTEVVLDAVSGNITFEAILHGDLDSRDTNDKRIQGHFSGVQIEDPRDPTGPVTGTLDGDFSFFFQRGGPAQPFS